MLDETIITTDIAAVDSEEEMASEPSLSPTSGDPRPSPPDAQPREPASDSSSDPSSTQRGTGWRQISAVLLACILGYAGIQLSRHFTASGNFEQGLALQKQRGKCTDALVKLDRALWFDPQMIQAYHVRATCHWRLGHIDQALDDYSTTVRLKPDYAAGYESRGIVHRQKGNLDAALADFDMAIRLNPAGRPKARMWRAEVLRERDDFDGALAEYDFLIDQKVKEREAAPAFVPLDVLLPRKEEEREVRLTRAGILRHKGDFDAALAEYDTVLAALSGDTTVGPDFASTPFFARVAALRERGAIDAALAEVEKGIARWPDIASGYRERALIALFHTDKPAAAAADFARAIQEGFTYRRAMMLWDAGGEALGIEIADRRWKLAPHTLFVPAAYDLVIQAHLARVRAGTADAERLLKDMQDLDHEISPGFFRDMRFLEWPGPLLKLFHGMMTPEEVRAAALAPGRDARHRKCTADFYLAAYLDEKRLRDEALRLLQAAADGCPVWAPERGFARSELKRRASAAGRHGNSTL